MQQLNLALVICWHGSCIGVLYSQLLQTGKIAYRFLTLSAPLVRDNTLIRVGRLGYVQLKQALTR